MLSQGFSPEAGDCQSGIDTVKSLPHLGAIQSRSKGGSPVRRRHKVTQAGRGQASSRVNAGAGGVIIDVDRVGVKELLPHKNHVVWTPFLLPTSLKGNLTSQSRSVTKTGTGRALTEGRGEADRFPDLGIPGTRIIISRGNRHISHDSLTSC